MADLKAVKDFYIRRFRDQIKKAGLCLDCLSDDEVWSMMWDVCINESYMRNVAGTKGE